MTYFKWLSTFSLLTFFLLFLPIPSLFNDAGDASWQWGWLTFHFFHADLQHWFSNISALWFLGWMHHYFYPTSQRTLWPALACFSGPLLSLIGQEGLHLGASALVYGLFHFLLATTLFRRTRQDLAILFILIVLFPGLLWAPFAPPGVSWEGHTAGAMIGWMTAYFTYKTYPKPALIDPPEEEPYRDIRSNAMTVFHNADEPKSQNWDHNGHQTNWNGQKYRP